MPEGSTAGSSSAAKKVEAALRLSLPRSSSPFSAPSYLIDGRSFLGRDAGPLIGVDLRLSDPRPHRLRSTDAKLRGYRPHRGPLCWVVGSDLRNHAPRTLTKLSPHAIVQRVPGGPRRLSRSQGSIPKEYGTPEPRSAARSEGSRRRAIRRLLGGHDRRSRRSGHRYGLRTGVGTGAAGHQGADVRHPLLEGMPGHRLLPLE